jgi:hypothetical protein
VRSPRSWCRVERTRITRITPLHHLSFGRDATQSPAEMSTFSLIPVTPESALIMTSSTQMLTAVEHPR